MRILYVSGIGCSGSGGGSWNKNTFGFIQKKKKCVLHVTEQHYSQMSEFEWNYFALTVRVCNSVQVLN